MSLYLQERDYWQSNTTERDQNMKWTEELLSYEDLIVFFVDQ